MLYSINYGMFISFAAIAGELVSGGGGASGLGDDVMEGEEGGGWEVGDDDLELPPDLVSPEIMKAD